jgi:hypothetical protein
MEVTLEAAMHKNNLLTFSMTAAFEAAVQDKCLTLSKKVASEVTAKIQLTGIHQESCF